MSRSHADPPMLNDWEERQLADIEHGLSSDRALQRVLAAPTRRERRWHVLRRRFYPAGYLASALAYEVAAMGGAQLRTTGSAVLVVLAAWLVLELRAMRQAR